MYTIFRLILIKYNKEAIQLVAEGVFCKVRGGSCITYKVYAIDSKKGCLIGNNFGHMNGWTKNVYGLAHKL